MYVFNLKVEFSCYLVEKKPWWREESNAEIHIDITKLYQEVNGREVGVENI